MHLELPEGGKKVLLHCCCAPCSGAVVECLVQNGIRPTLFFSNSNIVPKEEYELRRGELERYARLFGLECVDDEYDHGAWLDFVLRRGIPDQVGDDAEGVGDDGERAQDKAKALAEAPERGPRCLECFKFRLQRAARYAASNGFDLLTTTLASSRWKSLEQVDEAGRWACEGIPDQVGDDGRTDTNDRHGRLDRPSHDNGAADPSASLRSGQDDNRVVWWPVNWRKGGLQPRRAEIIREQNFYNQNYCGCEFSEHHGGGKEDESTSCHRPEASVSGSVQTHRTESQTNE